MFSDAEWLGLITKLQKHTTDGRIKWSLDGSNLSADVNGTIYLITAQDHDDQAPWILTLRVVTDEAWREIDSLTSASGPVLDWRPETLIIPLRDSAWRGALGGPALAKQLLDDLSALDEEPF